MSTIDDEETGEETGESKPHLMMIVFIQEERPDLRIMESWSDSIRTLAEFGFDACPECNSDPRNLKAYSTCLSCRLVGSGPVEIPPHVLNYGMDMTEETEEEVA